MAETPVVKKAKPLVEIAYTGQSFYDGMFPFKMPIVHCFDLKGSAGSTLLQPLTGLHHDPTAGSLSPDDKPSRFRDDDDDDDDDDDGGGGGGNLAAAAAFSDGDYRMASVANSTEIGTSPSSLESGSGSTTSNPITSSQIDGASPSVPGRCPFDVEAGLKFPCLQSNSSECTIEPALLIPTKITTNSAGNLPEMSSDSSTMAITSVSTASVTTRVAPTAATPQSETTPPTMNTEGSTRTIGTSPSSTMLKTVGGPETNPALAGTPTMSLNPSVRGTKTTLFPELKRARPSEAGDSTDSESGQDGGAAHPVAVPTINVPDMSADMSNASENDQKFHFVAGVGALIDVMVAPESGYVCRLCDVRFVDREVIFQHMEGNHYKAGRYICPKCPITYAFSASLVKHINAVHRKAPQFRCPHCNQVFTREHNMVQHIKAKHAEQAAAHDLGDHMIVVSASQALMTGQSALNELSSDAGKAAKLQFGSQTTSPLPNNQQLQRNCQLATLLSDPQQQQFDSNLSQQQPQFNPHNHTSIQMLQLHRQEDHDQNAMQQHTKTHNSNEQQNVMYNMPQQRHAIQQQLQNNHFLQADLNVQQCHSQHLPLQQSPRMGLIAVNSSSQVGVMNQDRQQDLHQQQQLQMARGEQYPLVNNSQALVAQQPANCKIAVDMLHEPLQSNSPNVSNLPANNFYRNPLLPSSLAPTPSQMDVAAGTSSYVQQCNSTGCATVRNITETDGLSSDDCYGGGVDLPLSSDLSATSTTQSPEKFHFVAGVGSIISVSGAGDMHICKLCNASFPERNAIFRHMEGNHYKDGRYICPHCPITYAFSASLVKHVHAVHQSKPEHQCRFCGLICTGSSKLERHVKARHFSSRAVGVAQPDVPRSIGEVHAERGAHGAADFGAA